MDDKSWAPEADEKETAAAGLLRRSYLEWAQLRGVEPWKAEVARQGRGWAHGAEVTDQEFNEALHDAFNTRIG